MKDMHYVLQNFFTHKDYLVEASQIPGTLFTPLHFLFEAILLIVIFSSAWFVGRRKKLVKPVFTAMWAVLMVWELVIICWDSVSGKTIGMDFQNNLSLYPCSIFLYTLPFVIWGKGTPKQAACGYICTLGLLGAIVNFLFPISRLTTYSCISFAGFHTFAFHGSMLFAFLVLIISGIHRYDHISTWQGLFFPCIPSLLLSIPANLLNYTIGSDYMYFRGRFFVLARIFGNTPPIVITSILYFLYIFIPALFYLPFYLHNRKQTAETELDEETLVLLTAGEYL